jgi:hypothetical protein
MAEAKALAYLDMVKITIVISLIGSRLDYTGSCYKIFFFINPSVLLHCKLACFVLGKPIQFRLLLTGKARAHAMESSC